MPDDEAPTIARCLAGDPDAWRSLFDAHYAPACRFVLTFSPALSSEDAEEICQEAFLSAIRNLRGFRKSSCFRTWLFRIAANQARDTLEKRFAQKRGGGQTTLSLDERDPDGQLLCDPPTTSPGPDQLMLNHEQIQGVRNAVDQLDPPCREVIELRYFGDLSYDDIAQELGLNSKTVSSRLSRCLAKFKELLRGMGDLFSVQLPE